MIGYAPVSELLVMSVLFFVSALGLALLVWTGPNHPSATKRQITILFVGCFTFLYLVLVLSLVLTAGPPVQ